METTGNFTRPSFDQACAAWEELLADRGFSTDLLWVFDENLCFEKSEAAADGYRLGFQTRITPPPPDAAQIAFEHFEETGAPIVFYRLGENRGKSVCVLCCDEWFASKRESDGYVRRDDWRVLFRPGGKETIEEITDEARWKNRILRDRPLHELDFCMPLRAVHEIHAHGYVLSEYERYALRFLHFWRGFLGPGSG